jgi:hypothetical protein
MFAALALAVFVTSAPAQQDRRTRERDRDRDRDRDEDTRRARDDDDKRQGRDQDTFTWSERMRRGAWLRVYGFNGPITVTEASGDAAEVRGDKRYRGSSGTNVEFVVKHDGDDYMVCAVYVENSSCDEDGVHTTRRRDWFNNDNQNARVAFTVRVPRGVKLRVGTGNGEVDVTGAAADVVAGSGNGRVRVKTSEGAVEAASGNGEVTVEGATDVVRASSGNGRVTVGTTHGPVTATTGNGDIDVRMDALGGDDDMEFTTGNGRISVAVPRDFAAQLDANLGHGEFQSDFPMTVTGRLSRTHIRATIADGRRRLRMTSGNGNIELLRSGEARRGDDDRRR